MAGILACLLVLAVLATPYVTIGQAGAVGTYYATGVITPFAAGLLAVVGLIVFAAGHQDRSDPAVAAGAALVLGGFVTVIAVTWALTVPRSVVTQLSTSTVIGYHRGALVLAGLAVAASAGWYVRSLGLA